MPTGAGTADEQVVEEARARTEGLEEHKRNRNRNRNR